ncbi:MAG: hypothetical protein ACREJM_02650, partial [Candidatus Saccharimonadales bacterium]
TIADLVIPEGVELQTETGHTIATVYEPSALAAANDAAGGTAEEGEEPEIEGEEGEEGESAEGEGGAAEGGQEGQKGEDKPGGKDQKEPKPSSVEAAKEDKKTESE